MMLLRRLWPAMTTAFLIFIVFRGCIMGCPLPHNPVHINALHVRNVGELNGVAKKMLDRATKGVSLPPSAHDISIRSVQFLDTAVNVVFTAELDDFDEFAEKIAKKRNGRVRVLDVKRKQDLERINARFNTEGEMSQDFPPWRGLNDIERGKYLWCEPGPRIAIDLDRGILYLE